MQVIHHLLFISVHLDHMTCHRLHVPVENEMYMEDNLTLWQNIQPDGLCFSHHLKTRAYITIYKYYLVKFCFGSVSPAQHRTVVISSN